MSLSISMPLAHIHFIWATEAFAEAYAEYRYRRRIAKAQGENLQRIAYQWSLVPDLSSEVRTACILRDSTKMLRAVVQASMKTRVGNSNLIVPATPLYDSDDTEPGDEDAGTPLLFSDEENPASGDHIGIVAHKPPKWDPKFTN